MVTTSGFVSPEFWSIAGSAGEGTCSRFQAIHRSGDGQTCRRRVSADGLRAGRFYVVQLRDGSGVSGGHSAVDGAAVAHALRTGDPVNAVLGPVTFDSKGDAVGVTFEMSGAGRHEKLQ
jgi:branched-chain amino acid transport system substrate-binding protein